MTLNEIAYNILNTYRGGRSNNNDHISLDQVKFTIKYYRAMFIRRDMSSTSLMDKCEFGNATPSNLGASTLDWHLGAGELNTALLNNLPSGGSTTPPNPTCDTHKLASQKVNTYSTIVNSNTYGDWFIPSTAEALLLLSNFHSLPIASNYTILRYHVERYL